MLLVWAGEFAGDNSVGGGTGNAGSGLVGSLAPPRQGAVQDTFRFCFAARLELTEAQWRRAMHGRLRPLDAEQEARPPPPWASF